jgi:hypothetical protein
MKQSTSLRRNAPPKAGEADLHDVARPGEPTPTRTWTPILLGALAVGVSGDLFLHGAGGPGVNLLLMFGILALVLGGVAHRAGVSLSAESLAWGGIGLLFATTFVLRASPVLQLLAFLSAAAAFALPGLRAGRSWLRGSGVGDPLEAILGAMVHSGLGPLRWLGEPTIPPAPFREAGEAPPTQRERSLTGPGWALLRGSLLAIPLLFLFGALFASADPIFADLVRSTFGALHPEAFLERLFLAGLLAWLAAGYLSGFVRGTRLRGWIEPRAFRPRVGILETNTVLALVVLLFATFVAVQFRYLFGGASLVAVTPGLTYAEYAREGFAQLVVAAGLVVPLLLAADWLARRGGPWEDRIFRILGTAQLLLLVVVIASAIQRVRVYQEAYGLTESRLYGMAFLVWLLWLAFWLSVTVLRGRRERFGAVALLSGFLLLGGLVAMNPDARIARANLSAPTLAGTVSGVDVAYLGTLSADAVPALLRSLPTLPAEPRCALAIALHERWSVDRRVDWREWNLSHSRARRLWAASAHEVLMEAECPDTWTAR